MDKIEIYNTIRWEIIINHVLMHLTTILVVIAVLVGTWLVENRKSVLSVTLPLLSLAWAASIVRFDFFIHRQGAYLRVLEARLQDSGISIPLWESWKLSLRSASIVVPIADFIAILVILIPTVYLLFSPAQEFFREKEWRGGKAYASTISIILCILLLTLMIIPKIAGA